MAENYEGIRLQKRIAMGDTTALDAGNFGVDSLDSHSAGGPIKGKTEGTLDDKSRGAGKPVDGHQANPDHGFGRD